MENVCELSGDWLAAVWQVSTFVCVYQIIGKLGNFRSQAFIDNLSPLPDFTNKFKSSASPCSHETRSVSVEF